MIRQRERAIFSAGNVRETTVARIADNTVAVVLRNCVKCDASIRDRVVARPVDLSGRLYRF